MADIKACHGTGRHPSHSLSLPASRCLSPPPPHIPRFNKSKHSCTVWPVCLRAKTQTEHPSQSPEPSKKSHARGLVATQESPTLLLPGKGREAQPPLQQSIEVESGPGMFPPHTSHSNGGPAGNQRPKNERHKPKQTEAHSQLTIKPGHSPVGCMGLPCSCTRPYRKTTNQQTQNVQAQPVWWAACFRSPAWHGAISGNLRWMRVINRSLSRGCARPNERTDGTAGGPRERAEKRTGGRARGRANGAGIPSKRHA